MKRHLLSTVIFLACLEATACSCVEYPTLSEKYESAKIVAIMESQIPEEYVKEGWKHKKYKFVTLETLKGEPLPEYELIESEPRSSCDVDVKAKSKYLVFHNEGQTLYLGHCGATKRLKWIEIKDPNWRNSLTLSDSSKKSLQLKAKTKNSLN
ncbi:MAG: hypothetical protein OQK04_15860 [Kangiellaceae bacterium]|nr:hypothetical protein [Kangiellaceae bacterium]MCW9000184.1 hypothetical protein [Kangiellaceae bacterium]